MFRHPVRLLLDLGSQISLISRSLVKRLKLRVENKSLVLSGIGQLSTGPTQGIAHFSLRSSHTEYTLDIDAHILGKLTTELPAATINQTWDHLKGLQLADTRFNVSAPIDIIIGADHYSQLILPEIIKGSRESPIAQRTELGWVVYGPYSSRNGINQASSLFTAAQCKGETLEQLLRDFWAQEEIQVSSKLERSLEEGACEEHFQQTHTRDADGRYTVRLPMKANTSSLGDSRMGALNSLHRLNHRLARNATYNSLYKGFLKEYEDLGHMQKVTHSLPSSTPQFYFPHHGVLKENSETTKLRVVFNGSASTSSGVSLNDLMHTGENHQSNIADVLLWTRASKHIFMTDITKMFRQIGIHSDDWPLQQILWNNEQGGQDTFQLTTVTYGTRAAPFLSQRVIKQLIQDEGHKYPKAITPMLKGRYVDDICGGADTVEELTEIADQVTALCKAGCFPLAKWHSNSYDFLSNLTSESTSTQDKLYEDSTTKILGLSWRPSTDDFAFSALPVSTAAITKRQIASEIAQLYDPLGFLAPVLIKAKLILQSLWKEKAGWDDPVSGSLQQRWAQYRQDLTQIVSISIPRWLGLKKNSRVEILGFSDASQSAMAATVYLKAFNANEDPRIILVASKTKVTPLKEDPEGKPTIPRLELMAAVMLSQLVKTVKEQLELNNSKVTLWSDSTTALIWITSTPARWKEFVRNRVTLIQQTTPEAEWRYVPGKQNPADCASRGITPAQLANHRLWWTGPCWLIHDSSEWPRYNAPRESLALLEQKSGVTLSTQTQPSSFMKILDYCSSPNKLYRMTAIWYRVISHLKGSTKSLITHPLTGAELDRAKTFWIKTTQSQHLQPELTAVSNRQQFRKRHPLAKLTPFIDTQGILRVGGRLNFARIKEESKHQIILPKDSRLTQLLIQATHERTLHGATQVTLATLRQRYWILGGRLPIKSHILKCVTCARHRGIRAEQLMGQLPYYRLEPCRAFYYTGVDYAGPVLVRTTKGRGHKSYKGWLVIFVCMVSGAVHLEVVSDYSKKAFIAAYQRFTARRGICKKLYSDCGTTFIGADLELRRMFTQGTKDAGDLAHTLLNDGTKWSFNPPSAPHFGGKWESAVKSVKYHLTRAIGDSLLTYEELSTLLAQIEAVLNSRPLEPLSDDPDDLSALTPGHLLIGSALNTLPDQALKEVVIPPSARWQLIQQRLQDFWTKWSFSYIHQLQARSKWRTVANNFKLGSLVLLYDDRFPPTKWPLARVIELHPGRDGLTRVVTIKTSSTTLKRPISKLVLLPISSDQSASNRSEISQHAADGGSMFGVEQALAGNSLTEGDKSINSVVHVGSIEAPLANSQALHVQPSTSATHWAVAPTISNGRRASGATRRASRPTVTHQASIA